MPTDPRAARWLGVDPVALWAPVRSHFPAPPAHVLEVGAGSGRDAAWFSDLGYTVTCVEPDRAVSPDGVSWTAGRLPQLAGVSDTFDLITLCAVLHLVPQTLWTASFARLAALAKPGARLIVSLRCPPLAGVEDIVGPAGAAGWDVVDTQRAASLQAGNRAAGVAWDWCVFARVVP